MGEFLYYHKILIIWNINPRIVLHRILKYFLPETCRIIFMINREAQWTYNEEQREQCTTNIHYLFLFITFSACFLWQQTLESQNSEKNIFDTLDYFFIIFLLNVPQDYNKVM